MSSFGVSGSVSTEPHPAKKRKKILDAFTTAFMIQPDMDQPLLSVAPNSVPSVQPGDSKQLSKAASLA